MIEPKEIKAEIRRLRKLKLQCRAGSIERLDLEHKIKDLKKQLTEVNTPEPEKESIISEILTVETEQKIKPTFTELGINLNKFTLKELEYHLEKLKKKRTC